MDEAIQDYVRSICLDDIIYLKRIARGVNMDITQLDEGPFRSEVIQLKVRDVLASLITSNRRLRLQGNVNFMTLSFLSQESGSPRWRGITTRPGDVLAANAGESFDLVVPPGVEACCISLIGISEVTLRYLGGPILGKKLASTARPIPCDPDAIRLIRKWLARKLKGFGGDSVISGTLSYKMKQEFLQKISAYMRAGQSMSSDDGPTVQARIDVVQRVEQHLLDDLAIPQTVDDLCQIAGTSRRTLEYAFLDYFGTSPKKFVKALRLNEARKDLLRGQYGSSQIVEIASGLGFTHMGQFAADYRRMFAERPSETLRRELSHYGAVR